MINSFICEIKTKDNMYILLKSEFGNFVVKTALSVANAYYKIILVKMILGCLPKLKDGSLLLRWKLLIDESLKGFGCRNVYS